VEEIVEMEKEESSSVYESSSGSISDKSDDDELPENQSVEKIASKIKTSRATLMGLLTKYFVSLEVNKNISMNKTKKQMKAFQTTQNIRMP
jgi:hypothetical protein